MGAGGDDAFDQADAVPLHRDLRGLRGAAALLRLALAGMLAQQVDEPSRLAALAVDGHDAVTGLERLGRGRARLDAVDGGQRPDDLPAFEAWRQYSLYVRFKDSFCGGAEHRKRSSHTMESHARK